MNVSLVGSKAQQPAGGSSFHDALAVRNLLGRRQQIAATPA
jgi:hypothetical protein